MKSVPELRAQIDKLISAIETQKRVLRDLETQRSKAQSELNSRLDPMTRLPVEITSDIFLRCVSTTPRPDSSTAPMIFLNICQLWRNVALSTPYLWAGIRMDSLPRGAKFMKLGKIWIARALTIPLSFSLHGSLDRRVEPFMKQHAPQLQNLELFVRTGDDLQRLRLQGPFRSLKALKIGTDDTNSQEVDFFNPDECVEILRMAPDLVECDFDDVFYSEEASSAWVFTHTPLRVLRLGNPESRAFQGYHGNSTFILRYIALPSLESLDIADFDIDSEDFVSFLTRSNPPLASLRMVMPTTDWHSHIVAEYLQLMPSLTDLELFYLNPDDGSEADDNVAPFRTFLEVLGAVDDVLPHLRNLTLWARFFERADYVALISVLTGRRASLTAPLQSFRLIFPPNEPETHGITLDNSVVIALRQFAKDDMHVHVGPQMQNLI
ncbi:hypothetical protein K438DRAFT_1705741 [Mycena galopus ATCC 62051]|nr:hypothetical protein K438DRAFT_1705741 [Mycena galopus ATCC 62051]